MKKIIILSLIFLLLVNCKKNEKEEPKFSPISSKEEITVIDKDLETWEKILSAQTYRTKLIGSSSPFSPFFKEKPKKKFKKPLSPLERWSLKELRLTGIVKKGKKRWALVEDPSGKGYIVSVGTRIGSNEGYIAQIGKDYILVKEKATDFLGNEIEKEIVVKLRPKEEGDEIF